MATAATTFVPGEREYVRRELDMFFSIYPTVAEGFCERPAAGMLC
jgi:hypothetical protein